MNAAKQLICFAIFFAVFCNSLSCGSERTPRRITDSTIETDEVGEKAGSIKHNSAHAFERAIHAFQLRNPDARDISLSAPELDLNSRSYTFVDQMRIAGPSGKREVKFVSTVEDVIIEKGRFLMTTIDMAGNAYLVEISEDHAKEAQAYIADHPETLFITAAIAARITGERTLWKNLQYADVVYEDSDEIVEAEVVDYGPEAWILFLATCSDFEILGGDELVVGFEDYQELHGSLP